MKFTLRIVLVVIVVLGLDPLYSQSQIRTTDSTTLKVGDEVPDLEFTNLLNTDENTIKLSDYKSKLIILDFWATWCVPCIQSLPKMDSLQNQFKDQLVILPITTDKKEAILALFNTVPELSNLSLPYVFNTNLKHLFPHRGIPHEVWIDGSGKVIAVTGHEEVTHKNIAQILSKGSMEVVEKKDIIDYDRAKPFLAGGFGSYQFEPKQILYSSTLTEGFEGIAGSGQNEPFQQGNNTYVRFMNASVQKLYRSALGSYLLPDFGKNKTLPEFYEKKEFYLNMNSRVSWEACDSSLYVGAATRERNKNKAYKEYTFHYEMILPTNDKSIFRKYMLEDLNRYFGLRYNLHGSLEKRNIKCWALTIVDADSLFKSKGGEPNIEVSSVTKKFKVTNKKIDDVMFQWINFCLTSYFPTPIINETNYDDPIDLDLGLIDPSNFEEVNKSLKKFGLEFKSVERELYMIIIQNSKLNNLHSNL